ncbi:ribosomal RNA processing protein 1 homolog B-like [Xyrichtys novacula]|uniref:Ribosomal RNA processing protein 1 homolog B-like n=1 Tax=Xyrichtys novacula TaxID=13765 RepID=A0AAV1GXU4_XYRNO|nr:ribosomal RNA processing protein 1 homolog B-like [Xyrichtys novacula]
MASLQEPEIQFAQRLASNEKPIRTKALKKLRKYINMRSQRETGGFTGEELLKLWKGLFYCLWMQDKPLLQEELSNQISGLIHSFQHTDGQFLYLESSLQTFKREWLGIDRLRMDKFYQLVRFMFRKTFELLKKKDWDSSVVSRFLELVTAELLQGGCDAPTGLQFHVLDLYMTELAAVGSAELTADQNLHFIEPFCKAAAKTKDRSLFGAICNSIFSTIIDQAPFAIQDLMKEMKTAHDSDSDSGQASEEEDEDEKTNMSKAVTTRGKQINGKKVTVSEDEDEEEDEEEDDDDDDELLHLEGSDTEMPDDDEDIGPVLQFNYSALADKLFELASRGNTPSRNRQRLYKIIKVLRDLSEGVFPQSEYPEEVSTDEDDDDFGSRKRMKKKRRAEVEEKEEAPAAKKKKGKKKETPKAEQQNKDSGKEESEAAEDDKQKKKRKKKKKKKAGQVGSAEENAKTAEEGETEGSKSQEADQEKKTETPESVSSPPSETPLVTEEKKHPTVTAAEENSQPPPDQTDQSEKTAKSKKKKKKKNCELKAEAAEEPPVQSTETSSEAAAEVSENRMKKKSLESQPVETETVTKTPETDAETPAKKKKKKSLKAVEDVNQADGEAEVNSPNAEVDFPAAPSSDPVGNGITDLTSSAKRKKKKKKNLQAAGNEEGQKVEAAAEKEEEEETGVDAKIQSEDETAAPLKKKSKKRRSELQETTAEAAHESSATPLKKKRKNHQKEPEAPEEEEGAAGMGTAQVSNAEEPLSETPEKKKKKKKTAKQPTAAAADDDIKDPSRSQVVGSADEDLPLRQSSSGKAAKKKKRKIPVVFEFEADEVEAAASINGLAQEETNEGSDMGEQPTPLIAEKSQKKKKKAKASSEPDFVTFQSNAAVPTPLFCKVKGGPLTPLSGKKKNQTPKSESKKVTFGLKNNKTAEFRKTDRSLLVSPDGSSRVPFDPEQKPKCGVLKSPQTPLSSKVRKTPAKLKKTLNAVKKTPANKKKTSMGAASPMTTPKSRPTAADFF